MRVTIGKIINRSFHRLSFSFKINQIMFVMQSYILDREYHVIWIEAGAAKIHRVVMVALYPVVKESFQIYYDITEIMGILIDRFMELEVRECVRIYEIFCRLGKQFDELEMFYGARLLGLDVVLNSRSLIRLLQRNLR